MTVKELMGVVNEIEELAKRMEESEEVTKEDKDRAVDFLKGYASDLSNISISQ